VNPNAALSADMEQLKDNVISNFKNNTAKLNRTNGSGLPIPFQATDQESVEWVRIFLDYGADPNAVYGNMNLLHAAAQIQNAEALIATFKLLIEYGGDIHKKSPSQMVSPIELLATYNKDLARQVSSMADAHAENQSRIFISHAKQLIVKFPWKVQGVFAGEKITLDDHSTITVPKHVKIQWELIVAAENGKITYQDAEKSYVKAAKEVPVNKHRDKSTQGYYNLFKSSDYTQKIKRLNVSGIDGSAPAKKNK
jgi:hypothetical protein